MDAEAGPPRPRPRPLPIDWLVEWLRWIGPVRVVVTLGSAVAVITGAVFLLRPDPPPVEASLPRASDPSSTSGPPATTATVPIASAAGTVVVHVAGAVVDAGVVTLSADRRVVDAVTAAGGPTEVADLDALNLAAPLVDGERIYVPEQGESVPAVDVGAAPDPQLPVDINRATVEQLDALPGIGPATAAAIVTHRDDNGPFASVDALADVRGIGPAKLDAIRQLVRT